MSDLPHLTGNERDAAERSCEHGKFLAERLNAARDRIAELCARERELIDEYEELERENERLREERQLIETARDGLFDQVQGLMGIVDAERNLSEQRRVEGKRILDELTVERAENERLREALEAEHEDRCGCDRPGDSLVCVAGQNFTALAGSQPEES